ncbi:MAG: arylsulfotransferase family protein [Solirubrobacteraceae bacterium]
MRERMRDAGSTAGLMVASGGLAAALATAFAAVALGHSGAPVPSASPRAFDVLPFPGTPDAAPGTNIDLPAASPAQVLSVTAVGSRSGLHTGRLKAQPAGNGTAFSPNRPFAPGERVSVTATFRTAATGTASGAKGTKRISFSFSVARPAAYTGRDTPSPGGDNATPAGTRAARGFAPRTHTFVTEPDFKAPVVSMRGKGNDAAAGDVFLDAEHSSQSAAYILNPRGSLLWYHPSATKGGGEGVREVEVQRYHGAPVLTYWQGRTFKPPGAGRGVDLILNKHYQTIHTITPGNGLESQGADSHEFLLGHEASEATAFIEVWKPVQANLISVGGPPRGTTFDWIIQEIDIATGKVIWEWHSLGHVPLASSYSQFHSAVPYDYFHMNSIQQLPDGNILISSRNTWAVYLINKKTGKIMWKLGGKHPSFKMGPRTNFEWQHDATLHNNGLVTLFDDAATPKEESQSRALELRISTATHRVTLIHAFKHKPPALATAEGSVQLLRHGNVFVGWGRAPYFSEYTPSGRQLFSGSFRRPVESQRAFRFNDWIGSPTQPPAIAVRRSTTAGRDVVYASWNGSTQVRRWQVLSSSSQAGPFTKLGSPARWASFETRIDTAKANYFKVQALGARGAVLRTSAVVAGP